MKSDTGDAHFIWRTITIYYHILLSSLRMVRSFQTQAVDKIKTQFYIQ